MTYNIIIGRSDSDRKKFGDKGTILIGRSYVKMGQTTTLSNYVYMDVIKSHVVLVVGKRGSGKCLLGDTLIPLEDGTLIPIKDLATKNKKIYSLNPELKIKKTEKEDFFERTVNKIIKLKFRSGKEIELTPEHPLLTLKGWKPANQLSLKSRIATPRKIPSFGDEKLEEYRIKILAYLITEGHIRQSWVLFSNSDPKINQDFKTSIKQFNPELQIKDHEKNDLRVCNNDNRYSFKPNPIKSWLKELGIYGKYATEKWIPEIIFKLPKENLALFLNRLFSCDGSIYYNNSRNGWEISYSSSSEKLIKEVQHLLLRFEILSKLRTKKIKYKGEYVISYEIVINSSEGLKFINDIGFFGIKEQNASKMAKEVIEIKTNPNVDTIPKEIWDIYHPKNWAEIGRYFGYAHPKAMRERIKYCPSRETLLYISQAEQNEFIKTIAESEIFWDEITSIEEKEGDFKVYDISVPSNHNFIANDIIVHNSYSSSVITEGIIDLPNEIANNLSVIMLDTMGVFWTMKYPNEKDAQLLEQWDLKPKGLEKIKIFTPIGMYEYSKSIGIPTDAPFSIKASELSGEDWRLAFELSTSHPVSILIDKILGDLADLRKENFNVDDIMTLIERDKTFSNDTKNEAMNRFKSSKSWGLFSDEGTKVDVLINRGAVSVLDMSAYATSSGGWGIKALVVGIIAKKVFIERMLSRKLDEIESIRTGYSYFKIKEEVNKDQKPLVWFVLDECLPRNTKIYTNKGIISLKKVIQEYKKGNELKAFSYNQKTKEFTFEKITKFYEKGTKELIKIKTETGKEITCTPEHKILTSQGFKEANLSNEIGTPLEYNYSKQTKLITARLLGSIFSDGYLATSGKIVGFSGKGNDRDLTKIKEDLKELGFSSSQIYTRQTKSKIIDINGKEAIVNGISQEVTSSTNCHKYFSKLGAPIGKKILTNLSIPKWLLKSSKEEKAEFLAALLGGDGSKISVNINCKRDFNAIRLSFNYLRVNQNQANQYAQEIIHLFKSFNIKAKKSQRPGNIRKDGNVSKKIVITIDKETNNMINFLENIGYRYCEKKEKAAKEWLTYLKAKNNDLILNNQLKNKAINLHKTKGFGKHKIAKLLNVEIYRVRYWIYFNIKTRARNSFENFEDWIKSRKKENIIYERIIEKKEVKKDKVYDISVENNHNFIAEEFIVHNCHELLPSSGKTAATDALVTILREGRQPGISLLLITQQPGKIHSDVLTQSDIVLAHRLTSKLDVDAFNSMMQSYLGDTLTNFLNILPADSGAAIILDDNSERLYPIQVRPKVSWHGGESPTAIKFERSKNLGI
ncbi:hypothetical protein J4467_01870 [Candidatus Woesearchaeota archaeon]|nr:hypothetical protein [Candidatus Woesearchaeota archaeon]